MPYSKVQFIGYALCTGPKTTTSNDEYLGLPDEGQDIDARIKLLKRAIETAHAKSVKDSDTLKVFVLPEFFFRGAAGAYTVSNSGYAVEKLQELTDDNKYKDWVFFFGSILGAFAQTYESRRPKVSDLKRNKWTYLEYVAAVKDYEDKLKTLGKTGTDIDRDLVDIVYNVVLAQKGGTGLVKEKDGTKWNTGAHIIMKEYLSGIDFIKYTWAKDPSAYLDGNVTHITPVNPSGVGKEEQAVAEDGGGIFEIDGITYGVEICLDHLDQVHRLRKSPQAVGKKHVQLHIVPSGGMCINAKSVVALAGGYAFNCDGLNNSAGEAGTGCHTEFRKVKTVYSKKPSETGATDAVLYDHAKIDDATPVAITKEAVDGSDIGTVKVSDLFPEGSGNVHVYGAVDIPPAVTVT